MQSKHLAPLIAGLALAFGAAADASAEISETVMRFCLKTEGREPALIAAATAAGWERFPDSHLPAALVSPDHTTVGFHPPGNTGEWVILQSPKRDNRISGEGLFELARCVAAQDPAPEARARLAATLGAPGQDPEGRLAWTLVFNNGVVERAPQLMGNADAVRAIVPKQAVMLVLLFDRDGPGANVLVDITRPRT